MNAPFILIEFAEDRCIWTSCGWGDDRSLMAKARKAINKGETPQEVIEFLTDAGFDVRELKEESKQPN